MIRGPVLPQQPSTLWALVAARLGSIETGLTLVLESFDCSDGELGTIEGLARDASGGVVLVILAVGSDPLLQARALSAGRFLERVGDGLIRSVPEAHFCPGVAGRVLVVGSESTAEAMRQVCKLPIYGLRACMLEPFRVAESERFAVRWLATQAASTGSPAVANAVETAVETVSDDERVSRQGSRFSTDQDATHATDFVVPVACGELWGKLLSIAEKIDRSVVVCGDRFARNFTWNGCLLGEVRAVGGSLIATSAAGDVRDLRDMRDVCRFGDQLLRAFVQHAQLDLGKGLAIKANPSNGRSGARLGSNNDRFPAGRNAGVGGRNHSSDDETLRDSMAASVLSPEEYSALGDSASVAGSTNEGPMANDRS